MSNPSPSIPVTATLVTAAALAGASGVVAPPSAASPGVPAVSLVLSGRALHNDNLRRTLKFPNLSAKKGTWSAVTHKRPFIYVTPAHPESDAPGAPIIGECVIVARPSCDGDSDAPEYDASGRAFRGERLACADGLIGMELCGDDLVELYGAGCTPAMYAQILTDAIVALFSGEKGGVVVRDATGARVAGRSNAEAETAAKQLVSLLKSLDGLPNMDPALAGMIVAHAVNQAAALAKLAKPTGKRPVGPALLGAYQSVAKSLGPVPAAADDDGEDGDQTPTVPAAPAAESPALSVA